VLTIICPRPPISAEENETPSIETAKKSLFGCFPSSRSKKNSSLSDNKHEVQNIRPKLKEKDYGAPKHGMSASVWSLLVRTKIIMEELMDILGLQDFSNSLLLLSEEAKHVAEESAVSTAIRAKLQQSRQSNNSPRNVRLSLK